MEVVADFFVLGGAEDFGGLRGVLGTDGFAVPACAFGVDFLVEFLVLLAGELESFSV